MINFRETHFPRVQADWRSYRAVAIESDDWGACEMAPSRSVWKQFCEKSNLKTQRASSHAKLESPEEIERLGRILERYPGRNGVPPTMTAFFCLANPDYERICETNEYHDIPIDQGVPAGWNGQGLADAWREASEKAWFAPEFHTRLHHISARDWMKLLGENSDDGAEARKRFTQRIYHQNRHYPEYSGMTPEQINNWIRPALETFRRLFGHYPLAGVTSDATPLTEVIWAANGITTFCLRNFSIPGAEPLVYTTKPWNNQDASTPMGAWNRETDVVYLSRNIFFEPAFDPNYSHEKIMADIEAVWERNEPAILSTHRLNFVSWDEAMKDRGLREFERLLQALAIRGDVAFMTTAEISQIYRHGHSSRMSNDNEVSHAPAVL